MKAIDPVYLLWLAWCIARSGSPNASAGPAQPVTFVNGVLLLWLDPKSWAMTAAAQYHRRLGTRSKKLESGHEPIRYPLPGSIRSTVRVILNPPRTRKF
ncbi:hypothetical protein [Paraburkholderia kururiensis]|uniref:Secreted protein n=1 Tax=Paraburkholderia kururiensis TaxID=984307 RepID=A0ABZ0WTB4_9BURK|nr:hypothetical protein [Paraburkholderia kururiensis]WQD80576.1 hypothetical protein U0042_13325 [Paraburkholderia kururiensis]